MPGYKTHIMGGVISFSAVYIGLITYGFHPTLFQSTSWFLCALVGSVFPDIDTPSMGRYVGYRLLAVITIMGIVSKIYLLSILAGAIFFLSQVARHRGLFHKVWFVLLLAGVGILLTSSIAPAWTFAMQYYALFFVAGALSHLILDQGIIRTFRL